ncbi:MAG: hypothetical protein K2Y29_01380 [Beijerinckiaceae bacterium]|nr:hypothetical protein [Beijerinckiaceae bacterium]
MLRCEIIRTCSHEKVAEAAILSIGAGFQERIALLAATAGKRPGAYVADLIARFDEEACDRDKEALKCATTGSDMPILDGLRWIVEFMIDGTAGANSGGAGRVQLRSRASRHRADRCARAA